MYIPTIKGVNLKNKTVILRVDINSPVKNKKVIISDRIIQAASTIKKLKNKKAKIVIIAHQSRPKQKDFLSLRQHSKLINRYTKVRFANNKKTINNKTIKQIKDLKPRQAILLENIRFLKQEFNKDATYVKKLSKISDLYINDAFSNSHRAHASMIGFPKYLPSYIGINFENELKSLNKLKIKNALYILAGKKFKENLKLSKKLQKNKKTKIIATGIFGQLILKAKNKNFNFGYQEKYFDKKSLKIAKSIKNKEHIITPIDFVIKEKNKRKNLNIKDFPTKHEIFDIGKKTITLFLKEIKKHKTIFIKGPIGYIEDPKFRTGTKKVLKEVAKKRYYSILGGGHLSTAIKLMKINKNSFNHISLSGGALVSYLTDKKLIGLSAIMNSKRR